MYYASLQADGGVGWVDKVANRYTSNQSLETYPFLGASPAMREWIGGRQAKGLRGNSVTITNKEYEATLEVALRDLRRDKTSQIEARVKEFYARSAAHPASLLSTLILAGPSTACYDGQYYFDTDHSEGDSGSQDNDIGVDISALPAAVHGAVTAPSKEEMQQCILKGIAQILSFKDDRGEPANEDAKAFLVMVPASLYLSAVAAVSELTNAALANNMNPNLIASMSVEVAMNARLTWTDSFAVFRTDSPIKGLILQTEVDNQVSMKDENSEFAMDNKAIQIGLFASRNVGYGYWQRACYVTMT
jgi:phage major head subunit gpT-like protein